MSKSREIIEIIADVVKETAVDCTLTVVMPRGVVKEIPCPPIHYVFGNAQYVKDKLDDLSKSPRGAEMKFPMIALFCPFNEQRNTPDYHSKAKVRILIACSSDKKWSRSEERRVGKEC